ncbi:restriction endonuclease subunit S [Microcella flavibacter]|uniref:restriction endonuclease subunit S n=1 Tax=Microcella flavibacter TaxID=1804990 RepID=UPI0014565812|nr:restriction endonuclease subunit S [Microcella flavibacter]
MSDWDRVELGTVCTFRAGSAFSPDLQGRPAGDLPFIKVSDLSLAGNDPFIRRSNNWVSHETAESIKARAVEPNSVVFAKIGEGLKSERIRMTTMPTLLDNNLMAATARPGLDPMFMLYLFSVVGLSSWAAGSALPYLRQGDLVKIPVDLPSLDEQRRIAEVLGALDDLIDTNERLGLRLTEAASAIGQRLLLEISSGVPRSVEDIATITKGYSYKSAELVEGDGWLVGLKNVGRHGVFRPDGFKPLSAKVKPAHVVVNGDLVVAQTDLTQAREVIGRPVRVRRGKREGLLVASLDLAIVRPSEGVSGQFIQSVLESVDFRDHVLGFCNGTTVLHMGARAIPSFPVVLPGAELMARFEALLPLRDAADEAFETAESLRKTRDELLPLLMSGAVRVRPKGVAA